MLWKRNASVDMTLSGQVNVDLSVCSCESKFPWLHMKRGGGHCWVYVCVRACGDQPLLKHNYRAEMLIIGLTLPSSFPVSFVGWWAVGVRVLLNHWQSLAGTLVSVWFVVCECVCVIVWFTARSHVCTQICCQSVGDGCGHMTLPFFHRSETSVNKSVFYLQEHSEVFLSDITEKSLCNIINWCEWSLCVLTVFCEDQMSSKAGTFTWGSLWFGLCFLVVF